MARKLWQKVEDITGNGTKSRVLIGNINSATKWLVSSLPEKFLWSVASEQEVTGWASSAAASASLSEGTTVGTTYDKILAVYRNNGTDSNSNPKRQLCAEVPDKIIYAGEDSSSLFHPTKMFPKFYKLRGRVYIKPAPDYNSSTNDQTYTKPGASSTTTVEDGEGDKGVIVFAAPPEIDENTDSWVLVEWENVVLMYAASLDCFRNAGTLREKAETELALVVDTSTGLLKSYEDAVGSYVSPTAPVLPSFSFSGSLPVFDTTLEFDPTAMGSLPSYVSEIMTSLPTLSVSDTISGFPTLTASDFPTYVAPVPPASPNFSYTVPSSYTLPSSGITISSSLPTFVPPTPPTVSSDVATLLSNAKSFITSTLADGASNTADSFIKHFTDEDAEMANMSAQGAQTELATAAQNLSKFQHEVGKYSQEVQAQTQKVTQDIAKYNAEVQSDVQNAQVLLNSYASEQKDKDKDLEASIQDYTQTLSKYQADVNAETSRFSGILQKVIQQYSTEADKLIAQYGAETGANTQEFTAKVGAYVNEFQAKVQQAMQKYQAEVRTAIDVFNAKLQATVQEYSAKVQTYVSENQLRLTEYQNKAQQEISKYQAVVAGESAKFQGGLAKAKRFFETSQARSGSAGIYLQDAQAEFQRAVTLYQWAVNELGAATGASAAPPQQQTEQRGEESAST
jgi:hypothetical protein|tara:strand:+ start:789 stop:2828 length:2040 start_codon:yes stop_codon:yes gene_type:complete